MKIDAVIPGGVRGSDHVHRVTNDGTCSRCRRAPGEDEVPLLLWFDDGRDLLIYCEACTSDDAFFALAPTVPGASAGHVWIKSTLGHGERMCSRCKITNREAAALGLLHKCDGAAQ